MSNEVTDPTADQMSDTPMESPEKLDKGKGKQILAEQDPMEDDDETSDSEEEVHILHHNLHQPQTNIESRLRAAQKVILQHNARLVTQGD